MPPAIEFQEVTKVYRHRFRQSAVPALTDVSFEVNPGEVCGFLGPNGAGKTTSISIVMGFLGAEWGKIRVLGYEPGDVRAKRQIGFVPENFAFYKYLRAEDLLRFHAELAGTAKEKTGPLIERLLGTVRLSEYKELKIGKYSRGMVQRIGIAQALLADPSLLIMDEPTSGLDPAGRKEVRDLILALKAAGKTIFLSSHLLSEVEQICDRAVIINAGRVVRTGSMRELLAAGDQVEIQTDHLPADIEAAVQQLGGVVERSTSGVRIVLATVHKREIVERLWAAGCDVISLQPLKTSLESIYMQLVGEGSPA